MLAIPRLRSSMHLCMTVAATPGPAQSGSTFFLHHCDWAAIANQAGTCVCARLCGMHVGV